MVHAGADTIWAPNGRILWAYCLFLKAVNIHQWKMSFNAYIAYYLVDLYKNQNLRRHLDNWVVKF